MPPEVTEMVKVFGVPLTMALGWGYGFVKGWWVPGFVYYELKLDRDYWRSLADRLVTTTEQLVQPPQRGG